MTCIHSSIVLFSKFTNRSKSNGTKPAYFAKESCGSAMRDVIWTEDMSFHRRLVEAADILGWITLADGYCVYLSPAWYKFTGTQSGSGEGYQWLATLHPEDQVRIRQNYFSANDSREEYRIYYRLHRADGNFELVWGHGLPRLDDQGNFLGYLGTTTTIQQYAEQLRTIAENEKGDLRSYVLSDREREVLMLIANGNSNDTISAMLSISTRTVEAHIKNAMEKLGASNRVHAVTKALQLNEIPLWSQT